MRMTTLLLPVHRWLIIRKGSTILKNIKILQTVAYFISFVALGLAMTSLGPTLPGLAKQTSVDLGAISYVLSFRSFGFLLGSLFSGKFYDRMSGNRVMAVMIVVMSALLALVPAIPALSILLGITLVLGIAEGAVGVGGNALLVWVHQNRVAPYMTALHFFYGAGCMLAPLIVAKTLPIQNTMAIPYFVLAGLMLPVAAFVWSVTSPQNQQTGEEHSSAEPIKYKLVLLIAFLLCLDIGAEVGYGNWIYTYVLKMNLGDDNTAANVTSLFWGALTAGRLLGVPIAARLRPRTILLMDIIGCLLSIGIAILYPTSLTAISIASICLGLALASVYPTALVFAERRMKITGQVTSFLLVGGSVGGMVIPVIIGQMFDSVGPRVMMYVVLGDLLAALLVYFLLIFRSSAKYQTNSKQVKA
jgi:MFS transporter, FHS family, Na+ dependent glucose transporter 1